ncbi:putative dipeptidase [Lachnellula willkommii]|uniref:Dipeptidase n=1 Tax=Lachnellula willkommii TaxID=215461 RepID=A0A559MIV1_9HELO|nr:putative dipeptidase [Lachnellula willkommii]
MRSAINPLSRHIINKVIIMSTTEADKKTSTENETASNGSTSQEVILSTPDSRPGGFLRRWSLTLLTLSAAAISLPLTSLNYLMQPAPIDPHDYAARAKHVLSKTPLIDGHNDLPHLIRVELYGKMYDGTFNFNDKLLGHTDVQRMRKGQMGGQFWSVFVECPEAHVDIDDPTHLVRDTLEQIDIARRFIQEYPSTFQYCDTPSCARAAFKSDSLGAIRQMYDLGARYITTTHNCDNAFGTAASTVAAGGEDRGLSPFGHEYVAEMNRLGMMIDLSHVSHQTMRDVLSITQAPVIFSHSGAYVRGTELLHLRHAPDDVLRSIKKNGGIVMAVFVNRFLNMKHPDQATIHDVVDHIMHIVEVAGWECVGVGSDFSGTPAVPIGLEDVSKYPDLVALLAERGATDEQLRGFAGENLLRVWGNIEKRGKEIRTTTKPNEAVWEERIKGWATGFANSPFMFRSTREKAKNLKRIPHNFNVNDKGIHAPGN